MGVADDEEDDEDDDDGVCDDDVAWCHTGPCLNVTGGVHDAPRLISSQICQRRLCFKLDKVASCPGLGIQFCLQTLGNDGPWCMAALLSLLPPARS